MNELMKFDFENNTIRFVEPPEQLYDFGIVVKDLATCLGYRTSSQGVQDMTKLIDEGIGDKIFINKEMFQ